MNARCIVDNVLGSSGYVVLNKFLTKILGVEASIILSYLVDKRSFWRREGKLQADGSFFWVVEEIEESLGMTTERRRKAFDTLKEKGILSIEKRGLPATNFYKINDEAVVDLLSQEEVIQRAEKSALLSIDIPLTSGLKNQPTGEMKNQPSSGLKNQPLLNPTDTKPTIQREERSSLSGKEKKKTNAPTPKEILRVWKAELGDRPSFDSRRGNIEDLFTTLKSYGYKEEDLSSTFKDDVLKPWIPKKGSKNYDWIMEKAKDDYEVAIATLAPEVKIREALPKKRRVSKESDMKTISPDIALDWMMEDDEMEQMLAEYHKLTTGGSDE